MYIITNRPEISTGSYDCTAKVFRRDNWDLLHNITLHTDSVWDLKIHGDVMATAGLDGTVGVFQIAEETDDVIVRFILQASTFGFVANGRWQERRRES